MRISLIGPGDVNFHFSELLDFSKKEIELEISKIAKSLANSGVEIELLPDRGICFEIAKKYKENKGKQVIASLPLSDKTFGTQHLKPFLETKINNKPLFDKIIDTENWFKHDLIKALLGNKVLYLGSSPGTDGEMKYAIYLYKLLKGFKDGVSTSSKRVHSEILAGENYTFLIYTRFLKNKKLSPEDEAYLKKFKIKLLYINSPEELESALSSCTN